MLFLLVHFVPPPCHRSLRCSLTDQRTHGVPQSGYHVSLRVRLLCQTNQPVLSTPSAERRARSVDHSALSLRKRALKRSWFVPHYRGHIVRLSQISFFPPSPRRVYGSPS